MTRNEHLLKIVEEECAEIAQRCSKALRFGIDEIEPGQSLANAERIMMEFVDLRGAIRLCRQAGLLPETQENRVWAKMTKIEEFLRYSKERGTLTE